MAARKRKKKTNHMTIPELSRVIGYTPNTVRKWVDEEGLPSIQKGRRGVSGIIDSVVVVEWLLQRERDRHSVSSDPVKVEKHKLTIAQRKKLEHELELAKSQAFPVSFITTALAKIFSTLRNTLVSTCNRLARGDSGLRLQLLQHAYDTLRECQEDIIREFGIDELVSEGVEFDLTDTELTADKVSVGVGRGKKSVPKTKR